MLLRFGSLLALAHAACTPAHVEAFAPRDASFDLHPADGCGDDGRRPAIALEVRAGGAVVRRFTVCCGERDALVEKLAGMRAAACDGVTVPTATVAGLQIGTTVSELSGKSAITLDQGEGYVAFQCDGWLPRLIDGLRAARCEPPSEALPATLDARPAAPAPEAPAGSAAPTASPAAPTRPAPPAPSAPAVEPAAAGPGTPVEARPTP
ncbi:MAG: hypothetical protein FJ096_21715 [Deltaproteobacteria bacterium]|nr:hypothetical protein [Deltaproteobacteria bacterium]